jgi:hypothetical protein
MVWKVIEEDCDDYYPHTIAGRIDFLERKVKRLEERIEKLESNS